VVSVSRDGTGKKKLVISGPVELYVSERWRVCGGVGTAGGIGGNGEGTQGVRAARGGKGWGSGWGGPRKLGTPPQVGSPTPPSTPIPPRRGYWVEWGGGWGGGKASHVRRLGGGGRGMGGAGDRALEREAKKLETDVQE